MGMMEKAVANLFHGKYFSHFVGDWPGPSFLLLIVEIYLAGLSGKSIAMLMPSGWLE